jgi:hypothetical protein
MVLPASDEAEACFRFASRLGVAGLDASLVPSCAWVLRMGYVGLVLVRGSPSCVCGVSAGGRLLSVLSRVAA